MTKGRLEAFSDGVLAIIITIMVLELKVPEGGSFAVLKPLFPKFISYILSFIYVGIYWNNHHHMFQVTKSVNGKILWANLHLLFWLSIVPFATGWMGENHFEGNTVAFYGIIMIMCAFSFIILQRIVIKNEGKDSVLAMAIKTNTKDIISLTCYISGIALSFFYPKISVGLYYLVAVIWFIPERRIEKNIK